MIRILQIKELYITNTIYYLTFETYMKYYYFEVQVQHI